MKLAITITITDDLVDEVMSYTHSSTVTEAVNYAIKDCLVVYKMRELNEKFTKKILKTKKAKEIRELLNSNN
jgi:Arc/MetJ family transcription regulator